MAKEYNIKAIVDKEDLNLIFECDKEKNKQCNKKYCGTCNHTTDTRYMKAKARQHNKNITDEELICNLESEIEYYRHELDSIKKVHEEDIECIKEQNELIKEYQKTFEDIIVDKQDIIATRTPNQIRKLLGLNELNKETLDKELKITIDDEEYLIKYNSNKKINSIQINAYLTKMVNEKDKIITIAKAEEFKIINKTRRAEEYEKRCGLF